jgi:hypothetical protein
LTRLAIGLAARTTFGSDGLAKRRYRPEAGPFNSMPLPSGSRK